MQLRRWFLWGLVLIFSLSFSLSFNPTPAVQAQDDGLEIVQSSDGRMSIHLPADWTVLDHMAEEGLFAFGSNEDAAIARLADWRGEPALVTAEGGVMGVYSAADLGIPEVVDDTLQGFGDNVKATFEEMGAELVEDMTPIELGDAGFGYYIVINVGNEYGFIAFLSFGDYAVLMTCTGSPETFEDNRDLLNTVMLSVRIPAESGEVVDASDQPTESDVTVARADDDSVSIILPDGWVHEDRLAEDGLFAFGDSAEGMQARIDSQLADDPASVVVSGGGGLIQFYDYDEIGIDPADPDLNPLMNQLQTIYEDNGYVITGKITEFTATGDFAGVYLIFSSETETGYLVLIGFAEKIVLMTSTATPATFVDTQDLLFSVVQSVSVPALPENDTTDTGTEGILTPLGGGAVVNLGQIITTDEQDFAISVPEGWVFEFEFENEDFVFVLTFAEDQETLDLFNSDGNLTAPIGFVGYLGDLGEQEIDALFEESAPDGVDLEKTLGDTLDNGTELRWVEYSDGTYTWFFALIKLPNNTWLFALIGDTSENFPKSKATLESIFKSITDGSSGSQKSGDKKK